MAEHTLDSCESAMKSRFKLVAVAREHAPMPSIESLHDDLAGLRTEIAALLHELHLDFERLEAKIDSKPSIAALYLAVVTLIFGIGAVVTATVVVLKNVGLMG
jgi:hypothetical protein